MLSEIRQRKVVQWVIAYAAVTWLLLQVLEIVGQGFDWSGTPIRVVFVMGIAGLPIVVVLGWYHGEKGRQHVTRTEGVTLAVLTVLAGVVLFAFATPPPTGGSPASETALAGGALDDTRYVILPFRRPDSTITELNVEVLVHAAMSRWGGIAVLDPGQTRDAAADPRHVDVANARAIARRFGSGRFIRGEIAQVGETLRLQASLHDTRTGGTLASAGVSLPLSGPLADSVAADLVDRLLLPPATGADRRATDPATTSFPVAEAYLRAHAALEAWDLEAADSLFGVALGADPRHAPSALWRAQALNWAGENPRALVPYAELATAGADRLGPRERRLAVAMLQLGQDAHPAACASYQALSDEDPRDFAALYGLGECRARDDIVLRDAGSPSGWAFRSSYHEAVLSYRRAFQRAPLAHRIFRADAFERASSRFFIGSATVRSGRSAATPSIAFAAQPALEADTLAFTPYPAADFEAARAGVSPATRWEAVEQQRRLFRDLAAGWVTAFPSSAEAQAALALAQQLLGDPRALESLRRARGLTEPGRRLQLAAEEVTLLIRFGGAADLARARSLADSVLALGDSLGDIGLRERSVMAAFLGRAERAAGLARDGAAPRQWPVAIPLAVTAPAEALTAYAGMGGPTDSLRAYEERVEQAIRNRVSSGDADHVRNVLLTRAALLSFMRQPIAGFERVAGTTGFPLLRAQDSFARGDTAAARAILGGVRDTRSQFRPTEVTLEILLPEAALWVALGDTALAAAVLDSTLVALRWLEPGSLDDVARAAALIRAMALRASLADAVGDPTTAARWAEPVAVLWSDPSPALRPIVRDMVALARPHRGHTFGSSSPNVRSPP